MRGPYTGRLDRAEPLARPTCNRVPVEGCRMLGNRLAGRVGAMLLAIGLLCACGARATPSPATPPPTADADEALMADVNAVWGGPYDAARVATLYAPNATFHDMLLGKTFKGLEAIQAKVEANASANAKCTQTSASIRQDNFVAVFHRFSTGGATYPVLAVFELKDGKVINQWAYPAP